MRDEQIWVTAIFGILVTIALVITPPPYDPDDPDPLTWDSSDPAARCGIPLIIGLFTWIGIMIGVDAGNEAVDGYFARANNTEKLLSIPKRLLPGGRVYEAAPRSQYRRRVRQLKKRKQK